MALIITAGAKLRCSFSIIPLPKSLKVLPKNRVQAEGQAVATIMDHKPVLNIPSFGMCMSPLNPMVIKNTLLAMGIPTPARCRPLTVAPWIPGAPTVLVGMKPALDSRSRCLCTWGGVIRVILPKTRKTMVP